MAAPLPRFHSIAQQDFYTPQVGKFEGYTQFPNPLSKPYCNVIDYNQQLSTKECL